MVEREELFYHGNKKLVMDPHHFYFIAFFRPFVSVSHARLTVLVGEAFSVVTLPDKVYNHHAMDIRLLADQILEIGCDDYEEQGIPDDLDNSSVETSEHRGCTDKWVQNFFLSEWIEINKLSSNRYN